MDKKQFATFAMALRTYFPKEQLLPNQQAMELWYRELQDIPYDVAEVGLRKWVSTNKWSPSIAEIREMASDVRTGEIPSWVDAWETVLLAMRRYGSYNAQQAMDSFDEITKSCVKRLGFRNLCMSENVAADRANFRIIYEQLVEREIKDRQIAFPLKQAILSIQQKGAQDESNKLLEANKED